MSGHSIDGEAKRNVSLPDPWSGCANCVLRKVFNAKQAKLHMDVVATDPNNETGKEVNDGEHGNVID